MEMNTLPISKISLRATKQSHTTKLKQCYSSTIHNNCISQTKLTTPEKSYYITSFTAVPIQTAVKMTWNDLYVSYRAFY